MTAGGNEINNDVYELFNAWFFGRIICNHRVQAVIFSNLIRQETFMNYNRGSTYILKTPRRIKNFMISCLNNIGTKLLQHCTNACIPMLFDSHCY